MSTLPPGPYWTLPATLRLIRDPYTTLRDLRAKYGDLVTFPGMNGLVVLAMTPELAKTVLTAPADSYGAFAAGAIGAVLGRGSLLVTEGDTHKKDRKLLTPPFHGARMRAYGESMQVTAKRRFKEALTPGAVTTMQSITADITVDVILRSVFGVTDGPEFAEGRALLHAMVQVSPMLLFSERTHTRLFPGYSAFIDNKRKFSAWLAARVADARQRGHGEDILSMMLAARYDDGTEMSAEALDSQLSTLLFAGHETTAIALAWAVHWLWRHPAALARVREELAVLGDHPEPEAIEALPYLSAVTDETLRLHPIVTENLRLLKAPLEIGGYTLPAGTGVGVAISVIHEDPTLYPDPTAFRPERFLDRKFTAFEFLPFGGGHRRCIGSAFAAYEMKLTIAELVRGWELELQRPDERPTRRNATLGPQHGVPVRVVARREATVA